MNKLTHLDEHGAARMVDVSKKSTTAREAAAEATIILSGAAFGAVMNATLQKGDVLAAARIAGIMAAKKTSELIPLCHPIALAKASIEFEPDSLRNAIRIVASAKTSAQTGVEMEALTAASIAALTIYDMTKSIDKGAVIESLRLLSKSGGKSGDYVANSSKLEKLAYQSTRARSRVRPSTLIAAVTAPPQRTEPNAAREAFRTFMTSRHLRATQWAKAADVPAAQIYAYLTGKVRTLPGDVAERLARAAKSRVDDMFR
jgi:cyclic pyranopterin phosphate synthase